MADNLNPTGPSQPTLNQAYTTPGNAATHEPAENQPQSKGAQIDHRTASSKPSQSTATPTSLASGVRRPDAKGDAGKGDTHESVGRHNELDGEQMAAPGEGKVAAAVERKSGASGAQPGLESDLDAKKAEQAPAREAAKGDRKDDVDVGAALAGRGVPAGTTD